MGKHTNKTSLQVKKYHDEIKVFFENTEVCRHKRAFGNGTCRVNIYHYLNTLKKKPGAVENSRALRQISKLKAIFDSFLLVMIKALLSSPPISPLPVGAMYSAILLSPVAMVDRLAHKAHILDISREKGGRLEETLAWLQNTKS